MTRGVLLYAHNNDTVAYDRLVIACAWFVKKHLDVPICIVSDRGTMPLIEERLTKLDDLKIDLGVSDLRMAAPARNDKRRYMASNGVRNETLQGEFRNSTRTSAYELSPFDETLMIDVDYILMNGDLSKVWGSTAPVRINHRYSSVADTTTMESQRLHELTIPQYWATVTYFRKSPEAEQFFRIMQMVREHYAHFGRVYRFQTSLYRNDHSASIAAHLLNGSLGENHPAWLVQPLPERSLMFAWDNQPVLKITDDALWFVGRAEGADRQRVPAYLKDHSVHIMNKQSLVSVVAPWVEENFV